MPRHFRASAVPHMAATRVSLTGQIIWPFPTKQMIWDRRNLTSKDSQVHVACLQGISQSRRRNVLFRCLRGQDLQYTLHSLIPLGPCGCERAESCEACPLLRKIKKSECEVRDYGSQGLMGCVFPQRSRQRIRPPTPAPPPISIHFVFSAWPATPGLRAAPHAVDSSRLACCPS
jgi:hypothetical protein